MEDTKKTSEIVKSSGFLGEQGEETALATTAGVMVATREQAEIQAACIMAIKNPRSEAAAFARIVNSCKRPTFAEGAKYAFPRGGTTVEGPSVKFAREAARCWGNIRYGYRVVEATEERTTLEGWALDLETNTHASAAITFRNKIQRKRDGVTQWITPDERDARELVAKNGAIVVRNAILHLLPPDLVEESLRIAKQTIVAAAKGELKQDRAATVRRLVLAFREVAVTPDMIERSLGHALADVSEDEIATLRGAYQAIAEGAATRDEYFPIDSAAETSRLDALRARGAAVKGDAPAAEQPQTKATEQQSEVPRSLTQEEEDAQERERAAARRAAEAAASGQNTQQTRARKPRGRAITSEKPIAGESESDEAQSASDAPKGDGVDGLF